MTNTAKKPSHSTLCKALYKAVREMEKIPPSQKSKRKAARAKCEAAREELRKYYD